MKRFTLGTVVLCCAFSQGAHACSVCMGASDSPTAMAANGAIFLMLGFVGTMLLSVGGFMFYLARRSSRSALGVTQALAGITGE